MHNMRKQNTRPTAKQTGVTVIEMMIAMAISLTLLAGILQIFINNNRTYKTQEAFARIQESGRFAIRFITEELRMAGYTGCGGRTIDVVNNAKTNGGSDTDIVSKFLGDGLGGYVYTDLPVAISDTVNLTSAEVAADTDIIQISRADATGIHVVSHSAANPTTGNLQVEASAEGLFVAGDYLFVSDCKGGDIFVTNGVSKTGPTITIAHGSVENVGPKLSRFYGDDAQLSRLINSMYYIGTNPSGQPSLFRYSLGNAGSLTPVELVEGVEDMKVLYGEDLDGDGVANLFTTADNIVAMEQVVSVRVTLVVRSLKDNLASKVSAKGDKRLRRSFTTTITIRNRLA